MYKMYLISANGYKNAEVDAKIVRKTGEIWAGTKDVRSGMGVKNISDLVLKELCGVLKIKYHYERANKWIQNNRKATLWKFWYFKWRKIKYKKQWNRSCKKWCHDYYF